jgi:hypothetical protein
MPSRDGKCCRAYEPWAQVIILRPLRKSREGQPPPAVHISLSASKDAYATLRLRWLAIETFPEVSFYLHNRESLKPWPELFLDLTTSRQVDALPTPVPSSLTPSRPAAPIQPPPLYHPREPAGSSWSIHFRSGAWASRTLSGRFAPGPSRLEKAQ